MGTGVTEGVLDPVGGAGDVRPHLAGLRRHEPRDDGRARPALAAARGRGGRAARATRCSTPAAAPAISRWPRSGPGGRVTGLDFSERMLARARGSRQTVEWVLGDVTGAPVPGRELRRGHGRLRDPQRPRPRGGPRELARVLRPGGRLACLEITRPEGRARAVLPALVRRARAAGGQGAARRARLHVPPGERAALPGPSDLAAAFGRAGFDGVGWKLHGRRDRRPAHGDEAMNALATIRQAPGLDRYLELLEHRLGERAVAVSRARRRGRDGDARGGRQAAPAAARLPLDSAGSGRASAPSPAARRSSSCTWRRSSTTTSSTAPTCAAGARRSGPSTARAARAAGDYLFARAFAELAATGDAEAVAILAEAALALARGEALQRRQAFRPETSVEDYLAAAPSRPGSSSRRPACSAAAAARPRRLRARARRRVPDRRRHPRLHAATSTRPGRRRASTCATARRRCRSSSPRARTRRWRGRSPARTSDALDRVAATGALDEARELALDYAAARPGGPRRRAGPRLARALTHVVVDRDGMSMAVATGHRALEAIRDKVEANERLDFEDGLDADGVRRPPRSSASWRTRRGGSAAARTTSTSSRTST